MRNEQSARRRVRTLLLGLEVFGYLGISSAVGIVGAFASPTIAATIFLQFSKKGAEISPRGHLTVWIKEQKLPPVE